MTWGGVYVCSACGGTVPFTVMDARTTSSTGHQVAMASNLYCFCKGLPGTLMKLHSEVGIPRET